MNLLFCEESNFLHNFYLTLLLLCFLHLPNKIGNCRKKLVQKLIIVVQKRCNIYFVYNYEAHVGSQVTAAVSYLNNFQIKFGLPTDIFKSIFMMLEFRLSHLIIQTYEVSSWVFGRVPLKSSIFWITNMLNAYKEDQTKVKKA